MYRFTAVCVAFAVLLPPGLSSAGTIVKSKSNITNNRFSSECAKLGGKTETVNGALSCVLPGSATGQTSTAVKGPGVPASLTAACEADGGKLIQQGSGLVCLSGKPVS